MVVVAFFEEPVAFDFRTSIAAPKAGAALDVGCTGVDLDAEISQSTFRKKDRGIFVARME